MKKLISIVFIVIFLLFNSSFATETIKAGIQQDYIPKGFYGSWVVNSKLISSNNPNLFNYQSKDIWVLSGYSNKLVLDNLESKAHSEITINEKPKDNKLLKFNRIKTVKQKTGKIIYKESVQFSLNKNIFNGADTYIIEKYDLNNKLIKKDIGKYSVSGVKISDGVEN